MLPVLIFEITVPQTTVLTVLVNLFMLNFFSHELSSFE